MQQVEPIIENALQTLTKVIDLKGSPLMPMNFKLPPPKPAPEQELSLESLTAAAAAPAPPAPAVGGGLDLAQLQSLLASQ